MSTCAGVFIDIDGVVLHGGKPYEWSKNAIHTLWSNEIPFMFVTNGTYSSANLVNTLTNILELPFTDDHIVVAPSPCSELYEFHNKRVLVCCQESSIDLVPELGFTNYTTIPQLAEIFPELDFVDHNKRKLLLQNPLTEERQRRIDEFEPIEAIVLLGEPINWESALQILIDLLMTNGDPRNKFMLVPSPHLPLIVCNKDLTFKGAAALPRFAHGAFLACLESLYYKITRKELTYHQVMGKPYLVTYEYAASKIQKQAKSEHKIDKFYIIGDNPDVDIKGANMYKEHLMKIDQSNSKRPSSMVSKKLQSVEKVESILVCTGVYIPESDINYHLDNLFLDDNNNNMDVETTTENSDCSKPFYVNSNNSSTSSLFKRRMSREMNLGNLAGVLAKKQLREAMSRKNSFIQYFEDSYNTPDLCVDNLMDAVNYIIHEKVFG